MARKRKRTYRRRRVGAITSGGVMSAITNGAVVAGGFAIGGMLVNNIGFLKENPLIGAAGKVAGAMVLPMVLKGNTGSALATGLAASGVIDLLKATAPSVASTLGISGLPQADFYPGSFLLPGVAGGPANDGIVMFD